jgi:hypothetical protein
MKPSTRILRRIVIFMGIFFIPVALAILVYFPTNLWLWGFAALIWVGMVNHQYELRIQHNAAKLIVNK